MRFPTMLRRQIARPIITLHLEASNGNRVFSDVLVDTGADVTLLPVDLADSLNIDLSLLPEVTATSAIGGECRYRQCDLSLELRRFPDVIRWRATIGFTERVMSYGILGTRGFFEFFRLEYDARAGFVFVEPSGPLPN